MYTYIFVHKLYTYLEWFVVYAGLPFTKFQVLMVLSFPTDNANLPLGCTARYETAGYI